MSARPHTILSPNPPAGGRGVGLRAFQALLLFAMLASAGYVHGVWTGRWSTSEELQQASARLQRVPMQVGNWHGLTLELDPAQAARGGVLSYVLRRYQNAKTGDAVTVLIAC